MHAKEEKIEILKNDIHSVEVNIGLLRKELKAKKARLERLEKETEESKTLKPEVSDHAIVRWLERLMLVDVQLIRHQILSEGRYEMIDKVINGSIPVHNEEAYLIVRDKKVVSVIKKS